MKMIKKKISLLAMLMILVLSISACGKKENTSLEEGTKEVNVTQEKKEEQTTSASQEGTDENGLAYKFSVDSQNQRVYDVMGITGTDLLKVQLNGVKNTFYVMDADGNTLFNVLDVLYVSEDYQYVYTMNNNTICIFDAVTHKDVTPAGVNDNFSMEDYFIAGHVLCTMDGAYNLLDGSCLWSGDRMAVKSIIYKANGLMLAYDYNNQYTVYNYLTGENMTANLGEAYSGCQINSAGYFCVQVGDTIKVYDIAGKLTNEFPVPENHKIAKYVMPGEHFGFYENKNSPYQVTVTNIAGEIVREDVYIREWSDTYRYYAKNNTIMVHGDLTNNNRDWYSGVLDSSMNWEVSQTDRLYKTVFWLWGDIYQVKTTDSKLLLYNAAVDKSLSLESGIYTIKYYTDNNKIIFVDGKMYRADTFELIDINYKDECAYRQLSESTFLEYEKDNTGKFTVYDVDGNVVTTVEIPEGTKYINAAGNAIITYKSETGYSMINVEGVE